MAEFAKSTTSSGVPMPSCTKAFCWQNADQESKRGWRVRQKTAEAEIMVAGGIHNVYISNQVIAPAKLARGGTDASSCHAPWPDCHCGGQPRRRDASGAGHDHRPHDRHPPRRRRSDGDRCICRNRCRPGRCGVKPGQDVVTLALQIRKHPELRFLGLPRPTRATASICAARRAPPGHCPRRQVSRHRTPVDRGRRHETRLGDGCWDRQPGHGSGQRRMAKYECLPVHGRRLYPERARPAQPQFEQALFIKTQVISTHPARGLRYDIKATFHRFRLAQSPRL